MSKSNKSLLAPPRKQIVVPARSKVAVNKSILSMSARKSKIEAKKIGEGAKLDDVFAGNLEIAVALLPTVPFLYARPVRMWIAKLLDPAAAKQKRNAHLSFLVFQMQNMKITDPFDKEPPQSLADSAKVFSGAKMKAMMDEMDNFNRLERLKEGLSPHGLSNFRTEFKSPIEFLDDQPAPVNGLVAYGGCFSNHFQ